MLVQLKILHGSNKGKLIKIPTPKCVIGRGDDCHLRPQSDAVSRQHAAIITTENEVIVRDMNSRNGTFVNGERVGEEAVLLSGDVLRVGPLEFELQIEQTVSKVKRSKVSDIKEAVARTAEGGTGSTSDLSDIGDWLAEGDDADKERRTIDPDTRQFRIDETANPDTTVAKKEAVTSETKTIDEGPKRPEKKAPGKLPPRPSTQKKDSQEAAADMLKKFFNRR
ncbi:MAG: FHA domain-containing protein [Planctomycetaceae bacterium]|nr:FHA domain-containing protein [Planctomycetaceae bacterium]